MTTAKLFQHSSSQSMAVSVKGSLLTLAILTFISFTYVSLNSLRSSVPSPSPVMLPPQGQTRMQQPQLVQREGVIFADGGGDEITDLYHYPRVFGLNYEEMERDFKVYIYPDGDPKTFYQTPRKLTGKYASEGYFFQIPKLSIKLMTGSD